MKSVTQTLDNQNVLKSIFFDEHFLFSHGEATHIQKFSFTPPMTVALGIGYPLITS